nr:MAG TPA: hypothetical protein [Caudoviricetes sp.]
MEWIKTILNAVRVAVDGVSARVDRLNAWAKTFVWVPAISEQDDVILQNTKITATDGDYMFTSTIPTVGATYNVTINGTSYQATAKALSNDGQTMTYLGDYLVNPDGDLPFLFGWGNGEAFLYTSITSQDGAYVVSIIGRTVKANKLPEDFVPDSVWRKIESLVKPTDPVFTGTFSQNRKAGSTIGDYSHAEGFETEAWNKYSHAEGYQTRTNGNAAHAEGEGSIASSSNAHAEGMETKAYGRGSHAEGYRTTASGDFSHAEGNGTNASNDCAHAEGYSTKASGRHSHAEGSGTTASGLCSHAEGDWTTASGWYSHAEGTYTTASGSHSHAEGDWTTASSDDSHVQGKYNIEDKSEKYAHIVGNGTANDKRSNAHTLDWHGVPWFQGRPQFGGTAQDDGSQSVVANGDKEFILVSSTEGSTKKFKVTVDDSGVLKAMEVTG